MDLPKRLVRRGAGVEHWDDALPLRLPAQDGTPGGYQYVEMPVFGADTHEKLDRMVQALDQAHYLAISSNRTHGVIRQLPARYPMTGRYYDHLFAGTLGFAHLQTFTHFPRLFGWEIDDSEAEEQFVVFDHPTVHLFVKTADYDAAHVRTLLEPHLSPLPQTLNPGQLTYNGLLLTAAQRDSLKEHGTWSAYFSRDSIVNRVPWLVWWLAVLLLGWLTWPLLWRVLAVVPDRGYLVAKSIGLLLLGYVPWLLASNGILAAGRLSTWLAVALIASASALVLSRTWQRFAHFLKEQRAEIVLSEVVFTVTFLFFLWVRLTNPDLWHQHYGGEKPMDFAHMNALIKAGAYPPYDPWFEGGYINYYYMGHQAFGTFIRWLGIMPSVAYNLVLPLIAALLAANVYTFGTTVWRQAPVGMRLLAGGGGIVLAIVIGNLDAAVQWYTRLTASTGPGRLPAGLDWLRQSLGNILRGEPPPGFDYWHSTRLIEGAIHEFPFFSFLYGDLHPHVLALPFTMLMPVNALAVAKCALDDLFHDDGTAQTFLDLACDKDESGEESDLRREIRHIDKARAADRQYAGVLSEARRCFQAFSQGAPARSLLFGVEGATPTVDFSAAVDAEGDPAVFVLQPENGGEDTLFAKAIKGAFFEAILNSPARRERGGEMPLVFYVADEFHRFITSDEGHGEQSFFDRARSYGAGCVVATQAVSSVVHSLSVAREPAVGTAVKLLLVNTGSKLFFRTTEQETRNLLDSICPGTGPTRLTGLRPPSTLRPGECYASLPDGRFERRQLKPLDLSRPAR